MPTARRLAPFGTTIFAEMSRLAAEYGAVNLGQGYPDFDAPEHVKAAAIEAIQANHNQYAPAYGLPALQEAIASKLARESGLPVDPTTQVTVTSGCTGAIAAAMLGLVNSGDEVVVFEPYYDSYRACISMADATPRFVTLRTPDFEIDEAELRRAFGPKTRAILVNTPHNPTGKVFSRAELQLIAELCIEHDAVAITDEVYEHIVFEGEHMHLAAFPGMAERTVTMSSLGKTFSVTGWKIGWAIASPELSKSVRAAQQFLTFSISTPMQHAAVVALHSSDSYYNELQLLYRRRRDLLCEGLTSLGFTVFQPEGSYFVLADHTRFGRADDVDFCRWLTTEIGVAAIPPSFFYEHKEHGRPLVRFGFCKDETTLHRALDRLQRLAGA